MTDFEWTIGVSEQIFNQQSLIDHELSDVLKENGEMTAMGLCSDWFCESVLESPGMQTMITWTIDHENSAHPHGFFMQRSRCCFF